jgi:hypothetical protein
MEKIVHTGYLELAKRHHSDKGGSDENMRCLIETNDKLKKLMATNASPDADYGDEIPF